MMELRIAVCDDAEEDRTYVSGLVKDWAAQAGHQAEITAFSSAESFLFRYAEDKTGTFCCWTSKWALWTA